MKIIEALKELKIIEKKMTKNTDMIGEYASILSTEKAAFGDEKSQAKKVQELIQSNRDLMERYLKLKKAIEKTNLVVSVEIGGVKYPISDALTIKRKLAAGMIGTYNALTTRAAESRIGIRRMQSSSEPGQVVAVVRLYDEKEKLAGLSLWQDLYDNIESRLEVVNAMTDLVED